MKFGIISDTHITKNYDQKKLTNLINQIKEVFIDVDEIIHAGDICEEFFLAEMKEIAPVRCVRGNCDNFDGLEMFVKISVSRYKIGVIHILPENLKEFVKDHNLNILIFGHTHQPLIKGTNFKVLLLNPGSPTIPKAPVERPGFLKPKARASVITLNIDDDDVLSTYVINLKVN